MKKDLIAIAGPTAVGKTKLSIDIAKKLHGEIISADSMQVYKFMDIGTAKPSKTEMDGIRHYLIDELYPDEEYNVAVFKNKATEYIEQIYNNSKIPIIVGGTGFYLNALINDTDFSQTFETSYRDELEIIAKEKGSEFLFNMLREVDPESCKIIHPNNTKRVIRALDFYKQTGKKISLDNSEKKKSESKYNVKLFILNMDRQKLYDRIDKRIDIMIKEGLVDEVRNLYKQYSPDLVSMQALGYKEIIEYLKGNLTLDEAIYILKRDTRHFAKRQITWFKHQCNGVWIDVDKYPYDEILDLVSKNIKE